MGARRDLASPVSEFLGVIVLCIILYFGGQLVLTGNGLEAKELIAYIASFAYADQPGKKFSTSFINMQRGSRGIVKS